ncbi:MAG: prepilin-type N-terminal cleavage/methylation domain-containing protein [Oceanospirillales bacterium]|uniref:General secretion pathway protein J n=1 Tax=Marinobacterium halophilum TaxID=267374 RepID=A0A2P8F342_9GAMM|nr:prepilin-type N-terminal cleavage/methylation domain-containing protein [Marinobacterium halophilum]MBR9828646.1 prepilin-type N-terminal cleavage/methylation domain-containing protein [Oceanospirillales bacterium]PSL16116.1 general secretion pathway protein J [Marinobacterium halophilum]
MRVTRIGGFTLLELLITLVLMGLVMLLLFTGLRVSTRSWEAVDRQQQTVSEQYQLQQVLRRLLSQARNLRVRDSEGRVQAAFNGAATELTFVAPGRSGDLSGDLYWYRLYRRDNGQQAELVLQAKAFDTGDAVEWGELFSTEVVAETGEIRPVYDYSLLLLPARRLELTYWDQPSGSLLLAQPDWIEQARLPRLIELRLIDTAEQISTRWPPLAVALEEYNHALRQNR